jgi:hypothetical protein
MGGACSTHGRDEKYVQNFGWRNLKGRELGSPKRRWEDNIRMDLRVIEWGGVDWKHLAQHRYKWRGLVNTVMNLRVP